MKMAHLVLAETIAVRRQRCWDWVAFGRVAELPGAGQCLCRPFPAGERRWSWLIIREFLQNGFNLGLKLRQIGCHNIQINIKIFIAQPDCVNQQFVTRESLDVAG